MAEDNRVVVAIETETTSGQAKTHVTISFRAPNLEEALRMVRVATDGAPLFKNPLEEGTT